MKYYTDNFVHFYMIFTGFQSKEEVPASSKLNFLQVNFRKTPVARTKEINNPPPPHPLCLPPPTPADNTCLMRNYNYQCIFRSGIYTHINRCRLCSLRVGLTVFIPESDTVSVIIMIMVIDLYHDVCVPMSSRWLLISESFLVLTVQDYPKKTLLMRKKIYIFLIQTDTYLSGLACQ